MKKLILVCFILASCSISDDSSGTIESTDQIIGNWTIIESGGTFDDGETFKEDMPCSNAQILHFFEDGFFDSEIWSGTSDGGCEFDQVRKGEWLSTTRADKPGSNYRLIFYEIPRVDDEEIGYPKITFSGNTMRVEYSDTEDTSIIDYTYRTYVRD
ncbi:hypothetical protein [Flagellimonas aurea]|uniref:hypothetical protein n=1 Tax=Flagellimonas aurea TaxID=2915619 RepID=UPI0035CF926F